MAEQISTTTQVSGYVAPVLVVVGSRRPVRAAAQGKAGAQDVVKLQARPSWSPAVNVFDTGQAFVVIAELAGVGPDSLRIELDAGRDLLTLRGARTAAAAPPLDTMDEEIATGHFERAIAFDQPVDPDGARAICRYGPLELMVPKLPTRTWKVGGPADGRSSKSGGGEIRTLDTLAGIAV